MPLHRGAAAHAEDAHRVLLQELEGLVRRQVSGAWMRVLDFEGCCRPDQQEPFFSMGFGCVLASWNLKVFTRHQQT